MPNPDPVSSPMATQEFYIRNASETEAHGPFTPEQLVSLAEAGKVDPQTLYYEAGTEQWIAIAANAELKTSIFPEKKRLIMKPREHVPSLNANIDASPPITVNDLLAAAEGRTSETKDKRDRSIAYERAARIGRYACTIMLALSMGALLLPSVEFIAAGDLMKILSSPLVYFGIVDFALMIALLLGAVNTYPFIRFRAALGLGFLGLIFWCQGDMVPVCTVAAGTAGLYLSTVVVSYTALALAAGTGLAGMLAFAYYMVT